MQPLKGLRVLDFSTLLPGPLAGLLLAEAGAEVIKIERPGGGDEMRGYPPRFGAEGALFALLNRGKASLALDLKDPADLARAMDLAGKSDVLIEQFRPGVMDRLGLGYERLKGVNPRLIYCSITGYGQSGEKAGRAGHDLNYCADAGLLALTADDDGAPVVPAGLMADIAGGSYPAVINILLALTARERSGTGCRLDIAMTDNLFPFLFWALGQGLTTGRWPAPGQELLSGGSPRYRIYRTRDGEHLALAALEDRFWQRFCALIDLPEALRDDAEDPAATIAAVAERLAAGPAADWQALFEGEDVCCNRVRSPSEPLEDPHYKQRGIFDWGLENTAGEVIPALPLPLAPEFRAAPSALSAPPLSNENVAGLHDGKDANGLPSGS